MCGFVGGTDPGWNYAAALAAIAHRGPDASDLRMSGPVHVGFRRLSIIDLRPGANQPMLAPDGESWIVFNGEIYGYRELRDSLTRRGHVFLTDSDTEVALHAYLEWGADFVEHVDGMFAIAIWDARRRELRLYRDRPGMISEVTGIIAEEGINIASLYCSRKQRGKDAFMQIDVDSPPSADAIRRICALRDMAEARYLDRIP